MEHAVILGRPTNLWLATVTGLINVAALIAGGTGHPIDVGIVAGVNLAAAAIIALIAGQPPVVNPGDTVHVTTPTGQPTYVTTIATPPAQDAPPQPVPGG
jgi:hypothetical protein